MSLKESADGAVVVETNSDSLKQKQNGPSLPLSPSLQNALVSLLENKLMSVEDMYKLAREFVKAKEGTRALQLTYDDRNMMNVLSKQIKNCKLEEESKKVGFLDLVGKDRLQLWKSLGDLPREQAMKSYIELIAKVCPLFVAHLEAHFKHLEQERLKLEEEERKRREMSELKEKKVKEEDIRMFEETKKKREEMQRKQIQEALNQQTYPHFKAYAEQQHPNNPQAQEDLIKQLQEQHFEQYMNQVYQQQLLHQQQQAEQLRAMKRAQKKQNEQQAPVHPYQQQLTNNSLQIAEDQLNRLSLNSNNTETPSSTGGYSTIVTSETSNSRLPQLNSTSAQVTTTGGLSHESINVSLISERDQQQQQQAAAVAIYPNEITPGQISSHLVDIDGGAVALAENQNGATGAVQTKNEDEDDENDEIELPPISAASMITRKDIKEFKESVRRDNDAIIKVGSGETVTVRVPTHEDGRLIFWEFATDYYDLGFGLYFEWTISPSNNVTVHVSDSSEDEDGEGEGEEAKVNDVEKGDKSNENKPPVDEIIPIFRRDCHEEVYAGSHLYPGRGVYLLKFDNSYSLWRSKTLYYRVYYSK